MGTQISIIGLSFIIFGVVAWAFTFFSLAYIGLILFGVTALGLGRYLVKQS